MAHRLAIMFRATLAATLVLSACTGSDRQHQNLGTLTVLYPVDERSWAFHVPSQFLVFLPLAERGRDGRLHGWLARSWEHSADWRSWTVHLRSDVRWHDGRQITAGDAKFSFELLANPEIGAEAPDSYSVRVLDDTTFVVTFRQQPSEYWMYYNPVYPKHLLEKLDPARYYEWDFLDKTDRERTVPLRSPPAEDDDRVRGEPRLRTRKTENRATDYQVRRAGGDRASQRER